MTIFDEAKPRTGLSGAKKRARDVSKLLQKLLETDDEEKFLEGLEKDFGITSNDPNYREIISVWKSARGSRE
jgi:hypothetical protein